MPHSLPHMERIEGRILLSAYTFKQLGQFGVNASGAYPESTLLADSDGNLFGTAARGGAYSVGTVFEIPNGSNAITALASFDGANGSQPVSELTLDTSGNLYGITYTGGAANDGTVFQVAKGSNAITTLAVFDGANGVNPDGTLVLDSAGNLYGATLRGGASNHGTLFEIPFGTRTLTTLASLAGPDEIIGGIALDASGNILGTAVGAADDGMVFEVAKDSATFTTLATFNKTNGSVPMSGLTTDASGNLYGTTGQGGAYAQGTAFEMANGSASITTLASFGRNTGQPLGSPLTADAQGNVYGTTMSGSAAYYGGVFEIAHGSKTVTMVAAFDGTHARTSYGGVTLDAAGNIRGTTSGGGASGQGTVFEIAHGSKTITVVATFDAANGLLPNPGLVRDSLGNLFGTTNAGGAYDDGVIFEIASGSASITTLVSFDAADGGHPLAGLAVDAAGNLYGTTSAAASGRNNGMVFELPSGSNTLTTLVTFNSQSGPTGGGLTIDDSGNLYGTTEGGLPYDDGTVFEIAKGSGALTTLATFNVQNGAGPFGVLTRDSWENLYGTTSSGIHGQGTVFELPSGSSKIKTLAVAPTSMPGFFQSGVVVDNWGNVYGSSEAPFGAGALFEIPAGSTGMTTLAAFYPGAPTGLAIDPSGNLFGATKRGGMGNNGTVFEIPKGSTATTVLSSFDRPDGIDPTSITIGPTGNLYATAYGWLPSNAGIVFELVANTAVTLKLHGPAGSSNPHRALSFTATISGQVPDGETVMLLDTTNHNTVVATGISHNGSAELTIAPGTLAAGTHNLIAVYGGDPDFAASESDPISLTILSAYFRPSNRP